MEGYVLDWVNLLLRWAHVITAIAWVGSSFYFVFLDNSLTRPTAPDLTQKGVDGELWAVHGGGFYNPQKYLVAPKQLPEHLHWFYWESYSTWLTGFGLFTVLYLFNAGTFLVDKSVHDWSPGLAIGASLAFLAVFWFVYDLICRTLGKAPGGDRLVGLCVAVVVVFASWLACQLFAGRAAFLLVGAMMATAMSANVFFWIIPGQRTVIAQMKAGQPVDPVHGQRGKQRSVHNTYFTLPVLVAMLSNHYSFTWGHPQNWLVLVLMMFAGAAIRQFFVMRHGWKLGRNRHPLPHAAVGVAVIVATIIWMMPVAPKNIAAGAQQPGAPARNDYESVRRVLDARCLQCHGAQVQMKNVRLDSPEAVKQHAQAVYQQAVVARLMPMNNSTGMTEDERALIGRWFQQGARVD